jgi:GNAT superfamily N-acetyltransferase
VRTTAEFTVRAPREDEVDAIVDLMNACTVDEIGVPDAEPNEVLWTWRKSTFDRDRDAWVAEAGDRLVGYGFVELEAEGGDLLVDVYVEPSFKGRGVGSRLSDLGERRAVQVGVEHGKEAPVEVFRGAFTGTEGATFLAARGYELTRCFIRMRIDMDEPPAPAIWPDGITVEGFERGRDEHLFHESLEEAFQDHWRWTPVSFEEWAQGMIENDDGFDGSLWFRAMEGDQVAGAIVGRPRSSEDPNAGWIQDLAIRRPWRRRGIALALLRHELGVLYRRGIRAAMLAVDSESPTGATRLYERAGMHEHRRIDVFVKAFGST